MGLIPENELTRNAQIVMDRRTNGAVVYENMETSAPGIFASGNVVHVHDLVDFVTAESKRAGAAAAKYALATRAGDLLPRSRPAAASTTPFPSTSAGRTWKRAWCFLPGQQCLPGHGHQSDSGDTQLCAFKREHMAPGEMEKITIPKVLLDKASDEITVSVEHQ